MIDKSYPVPESNRNKYPFSEMEIGDSIFDKGCEKTRASKVRIAALKFARKTGAKFTAKKTEGGVRIWRVE